MLYRPDFNYQRVADQVLNRNFDAVARQFDQVAHTFQGFPVLDVRDFKARGDGVHDDTEAFQAAVLANGTSSVTIIVPDNMKIANAISLPDLDTRQSILIKGSKPWSKILFTNTTQDLFNFPITGAYKLCRYHFEDLLIYGPGAVSGNAVKVDGTGYYIVLNLRNVRIENFGAGSGIEAKEVYGSSLENVFCYTNSIGIKWTSNANACRFYNVSCLENKTYGAYISGIASFGWYGGWIEDNLEHGLYIAGLEAAMFDQIHFEGNNANHVGARYALFLDASAGKANNTITFNNALFADPDSIHSQIYMSGAAGWLNNAITFLNCRHKGTSDILVLANGWNNIEILGGNIPSSLITHAAGGDIFQHGYNPATGFFDFPFFLGNKHLTYGTSIPAGAIPAIVGDVCWHIDAAPGEPMGWQCTVAGTPGTWKALANLAI